MNSLSNSVAAKMSIWMAYTARLAFGITIVLIPLRARHVLTSRPVPAIYMDFTDIILYVSDISVLALLIFWFLSLLFRWRPVRLGPKFIWIPILGLCFAALFSIPSSLDPSLSLYHLLRFVVLFLLYLYVVNEIRSSTWIIVAISIQIFIQSIVAAAQFLLQSSIGLQSLGEHNLDPQVRGVSIVSDGLVRLLRAYGLTEHPNILGGCLAFSLLILLATYLHNTKRVRVILLFLFLPGLLALLLTFSRSAWLGFLAGSTLLVATEAISRRWANVKAVSWLAVAGILLLAPFIWTYRDFIGARLNYADSFEKIPAENQSIVERLLLNEIGLRIFLDRPIAGVGLGTAVLAVQKYYPDYPGTFVPPHFSLLVAGMETGIFGALSYLCLSIFPWLILWREKISLSNNIYLLTASALLLAITLIGLFDIYPWLPSTGRLWQWLIWGWWSAAYEWKT